MASRLSICTTTSKQQQIVLQIADDVCELQLESLWKRWRLVACKQSEKEGNGKSNKKIKTI